MSGRTSGQSRCPRICAYQLTMCRHLASQALQAYGSWQH